MYKPLLKAVTIAVIVNTSITTSFAKYDSFKLGHAAGAYIAINDLFEKLKKSKCGYVIKKSYNFKSALNEVTPYLNNKDRNELLLWVSTQKFKNKLAKNDEFINGFLNVAAKDMDEKTLCGMLVSIAAISHLKATNDWNYAIEHFLK
jgi:hypothetical protein